RMAAAISAAWVSSAKCPVSKKCTTASGMSRLNAHAAFQQVSRVFERFSSDYLSGATSNAYVLDSQGVGTIINDDSGPIGGGKPSSRLSVLAGIPGSTQGQVQLYFQREDRLAARRLVESVTGATPAGAPPGPASNFYDREQVRLEVAVPSAGLFL